MTKLTRNIRRRAVGKRTGMALLLALFVFLVTSSLVVHTFDSEMVQQSIVRNHIDYEKALYLAGAGVQHAAAELEQNVGWRGSVTDIDPVTGDQYSAVASDGDVASEVAVESLGTSGHYTRRLQVTIKIQ